jgi:hypothetical protein
MLAQDSTTSIAAKIEERDRRTALQNLKLDESWKGTQNKFLQHFLAHVNCVTALNQDLEFALSQAQLKQHLEAAVHPAKNLCDIQLQEMDSIVSREEHANSHDQHFLCLTAAVQLDDGAQPRRLPTQSLCISHVTMDLEPEFGDNCSQHLDTDLQVSQV